MEPYSRFTSVPQLLVHRAVHDADRVAVTFEDGTCTYAQLDERAARVQTWLEGAGVRAGDRVVLLMRNSLDFLYVWLGAARAGAVGVPLNTSSLGEALAHPLTHSEAVGVFADDDLLKIVADSADVDGLWLVATSEIGGLIDASHPAVSPADVAGPDPMNIIYTSGTTGLPKGVVLSHTSYLNTGGYFAHHLGLDRDDVLQTCLPLFHCNAQQTTCMAAFSLGARVALHGKFSLSRFPQWLAESGATVTNLLGSMLALLSKTESRPEDAATALRLIVAAPVPEDLHGELEQRYGVRVVEGYGLTETGTMACMNPLDDRRPGTFGLPLEHTELKIVGADGVELDADENGELWVRSAVPNAFMSEYFRDPGRTAEALDQGWFHTGDICRRRPDGYYVFVDRLKDTIRRRGENISSFLVEKALLEHPDILEVAAIGVPSELSEEDVLVVVVARAGSGLDEAAVHAFSSEVLGDYMRPRYVELRDDLPRTETGRVHKFSLRQESHDRAWDAQALPASGRTR
ncbi:AMP-binding protein [Nocardioides carbamazepini]|uniref:AMP-binding protein n=1 Tax=Nocardioides carbamazepini TaxID=2854259 RepID=UPI00214A157B|nr:AMP-binding protein [Nocardioides carbamazepini]MCR1783673.1 AMP-binding protein [Nocardioides carbamazepini]